MNGYNQFHYIVCYVYRNIYVHSSYVIIMCIILHNYIILGARPCPFPGDMRCNSTQACVRADQWCNNRIDCDDGSDEDNCCRDYFIIYSILIYAETGLNFKLDTCWLLASLYIKL